MKKAAAALCVGVGSLSDPRTLEDGFGLEGLAHFVEHMLFMGTVPYPDENGWSAFLSSHGGEDNGETHSEATPPPLPPPLPSSPPPVTPS